MRERGIKKKKPVYTHKYTNTLPSVRMQVETLGVMIMSLDNPTYNTEIHRMNNTGAIKREKEQIIISIYSFIPTEILLAMFGGGGGTI